MIGSARRSGLGLVRIGTRGSQLALWQAGAVAATLAAEGAATEIVVIKTTGDRLGEAPLSEAGGKRLFVREIEEALLDGRVEVAVHSAKDMPIDMPDDLAIVAVLPRADPRDALVLPAGRPSGEPTTLEAVGAMLGVAPRIGTSSVRRVAQLRMALPGATFLPIRGNLDTRLRKLDDGQFDAIVLACAGLERLGAARRISVRLPLAVSMPSPGQGIIAVQLRRDAPEALRAAVRAGDDAVTHAALDAERALVRALGGGCQTPIGAIAVPRPPGGLEMQAMVASDDGRSLRASGAGTQADAAALGASVGARLLADGAADLLAASAHEPGDG